MPLAPIWKDRIVTLASGSEYADFEIRLDDAAGDLIYSGRAYRRPGSADVVARINDVCADYLSNPLPNIAPGFTSLLSAVTFAVVVYGSVVDTVTFFDDWSYDPDFDPATDPLADPVNGELDPRQWLTFSVLPGTPDVTAVLRFRDGTSASVVIPVALSADFNDDFNADFADENDPDRAGTALLNLTPFNGLASVEVNGVRYTVRPDGCARYAAYYVNARGGWDSLILDGYDTRRDQLVRHTTLTDYDNADLAARGRRDYVIEVTPGWTLRTRRLTDAQSARMHNLLNSPQVYLCDLAEGRFHPVVLTDTDFTRQSFKGNGLQPNQYTFNANLAQERFRR